VDEVTLVTGVNADAHFWHMMQSNPYLGRVLRLLRQAAVTEYKVPEPLVVEPPPRVHLPVEHPGHILEGAVEQMGAPSERELRHPELGLTAAIKPSAAGLGYDQIIQHHQGKDEALLRLTIAARLRPGNPERNNAEYRRQEDIGRLVFANWRNKYKMPDKLPHDDRLWEEAPMEVQARLLEKSAKELERLIPRLDRTFDLNRVDIFLKSQEIKKESTHAKPTKPGQTIAAFAQEVVMRTGRIARYVRRQVQRYMPERVFIMCEKTPADAERWRQRFWNHRRPAFSNDFKAFDQSQRGETLAFEVQLCLWAGVPQEEIDFYVWLKLNTKFFGGFLAIMRQSGEGPTFDFNTFYNQGFIATKYTLPEDVSEAFAGDDYAADAVARIKRSFHAIAHRFALSCKEFTHEQRPGDWAPFCGDLITNLGLIKSPNQLHIALEHAKARGALSRLAISYATQLSRAYELGDGLYHVLTERELSQHQLSVRILARSAHLNPADFAFRALGPEAQAMLRLAAGPDAQWEAMTKQERAELRQHQAALARA